MRLKPRLPRKLKPDEKVSFIEHLEELRYRLIVCLVSVLIGTVVAYVFKEEIFRFISTPLLRALPPGEQQLIFTGLLEAFVVYLKASFFAGLMLSVPVVLYQLWAFVSPGLYPRERKLALPFIFFASLFFLGGAVFGYYVVFPYGFQFFVGFGGDFIKPLPSMKEYLSFATFLLLAFGIVFELPIFIFFLAKLGLVHPRTLRKGRRYAIPVIFLVSAIMTPGPDPISQCLMAVPLCVLYELGIWVAVFFGKPSRDEKEAAPQEGSQAQEPQSPSG
ncbi:MAG: twin-arginine translocase subunit TatC [Thermodesulfobacteriota bacterium]